jgi:exopolysaccharide production protein ExoZ
MAASLGIAFLITGGVLEVNLVEMVWPLRLSLPSGGSMLLIGGLAAWEQANPLKLPRFVLVLGDASYSIYLVHYPVLSALAKITKTMRFDTLVPHAILFVGFLVVATAAGLAFYVWIERPLRKIGKRATAPQYKSVPIPVRQAA